MKKPPKPKDVMKARSKIFDMVGKYGTKGYRRKRKKCERVVQKVLKRYNIKGTLTEAYWSQAFTCYLIGEN